MTVTTTGALRVLGPRDLPALRALLARDPVAHCTVASWVATGGLDSWRAGGEVWGWSEDGQLVSAVYVGANFIPVETTPTARRAFADRARRVGRRSSSVGGRAEEVTPLWELLEPSWGPAREIRRIQPVMVIEGEPAVAADPGVRPFRLDELDVVLPACIAMSTEELGVSPVAHGRDAYRARVAELIRSGRAYGRIEDGAVVFKAEVGAAAAGACQVQGVWVDPAHRGRGLAAPGMAAVVRLAVDLAPVVSLYVNDFNRPALRTYERVGFRRVGTFSTVLF